MSEQILQRVVSAVNDKRLVLFNSQIARQLSIGSTWTYLRIGVRFAIQGTATFGPFRMFVGVTSGVDHVWASDYCQHALGFMHGTNVTTSTYNATAGGTYALGQSPIMMSKVSQTEVVQSIYTLASASYVAADAPNRNCFETFDIIKIGGGIYTGVTNGGVSISGTSIANISYDLIRAAMLAPDYTQAATIAGLGAGAPRNTGTALNEGTNGAFDSVCVYWRHPSIGLEISDVLVARIS